jgi:hypothetical protein
VPTLRGFFTFSSLHGLNMFYHILDIFWIHTIYNSAKKSYNVEVDGGKYVYYNSLSILFCFILHLSTFFNLNIQDIIMFVYKQVINQYKSSCLGRVPVSIEQNE